VDPAAVQALTETENARFVAERPRSAELNEQGRRSMPRGVPMAWMDDLSDHPPVWIDRGEGATFTDVDGHTYLDMYVADMSAFCGHAPPPAVEAVATRIALGNQFLMPSEDAIVVAEHLAARYGLPKWQFTLSATQANTEVIRLARELTGREVVLVFDGKYHGELDTTLVVVQDGQVVPEMAGLARSIAGEARVIPFNDVAALEAALAPEDVALVLAEPAMTNVGFLLPADGYHDALRRATRETGTLLGIDETHSLVCAYAGFTRDLGLDPDFLTLGKSIAAGVPLAAYGMREEIAALIAQPKQARDANGVVVDEVATGGTLFANPLSMAAGRAALLEVLTEEACERTAELGGRMAAGLRDAFVTAGLPWSVVQYGAHAFYFFAPEPPTDGAGSRAADDPALRNLIRVFMANRGVWESGWWLGPTVSVAHTADDVDRYLEVFEELLSAVA
jgi:glutamate-1-semialdehyde 2,1-aminomutase